MSTPVGQSARSPCTTGTGPAPRRPPGRPARRTSEPSSASCSTRARPRVESFSSRVARYDGHITPPVAGPTHLPTPVQRCTASPSEPPSWVSRSAVRTGARPGRAQVGVDRRRIDEHAGVEQAVGVADRLDRGEQAQRLRRRTSAATAPTGPGRRRARPTASRRSARSALRAGHQELAEPARRRRRTRSRSARARSRRRSGRRARRRARARAAARRSRAARRRGARAGRRRPPSRSTPAGVRLRAASPAPSSRIRHSAAASAGSVDHARCRARRPRERRLGPARPRPGELDEQPAGAARQVRHAPPAARTRSTIRASSPSQATSRPLARPAEQRRAPRRRPRPSTGSPSTTSRRAARRRPARTVASSTTASVPSRADQEPVEPSAVLGQQVLEGVAADLPAEPTERRCGRGPRWSSTSAASRAGPSAVDPGADRDLAVPNATRIPATLSLVRP